MEHKKRALISVFDKSGVDKLAQDLERQGWEIVSSSGTARFLKDAGVTVREIADLTGYPHMLGGRVKTLHPSVFGGILARRHFEEDLTDVEQFGIPLIDMVVCNLYPFEEAARAKNDLENLLENIDIGGVTLIRAAAKNFHQVIIATEPEDYSIILEEIKNEGNVTLHTRETMALKAFAKTSMYDSMIFEGLSESVGIRKSGLEKELPMALRQKRTLRYGENPHQQASLYLPPLENEPWEQLSGKDLSYNNILDLDCALRGISLLQDDTGALVIKHTTPCGMAYGNTPEEAYTKAFACDPLSAFGGVVGITRKVNMKTAEAISENYTEILVAPEYDTDALNFLSEKKPSLRILKWTGGKVSNLQLTGTWSGILVQEDSLPPFPDQQKGQWIGTPRADLWNDLVLAWKIAALSKSNAVAIVKNREATGIGMGFCSRVFAVDFAVRQAGEKAKGAVLASDAFFPFSDGIEVAAESGIQAIIQPGGSKRDEEVFKTAEDLGISMFISDWRTFRH
jgi:phosphoribosylaminoimidazolecarboxamide formyltransferase/IMP cyclohydrolase